MNLDTLPRRRVAKKEAGGLSLEVVGIVPLVLLLNVVTVVSLLATLA